MEPREAEEVREHLGHTCGRAEWEELGWQHWQMTEVGLGRPGGALDSLQRMLGHRQVF